MSELTQDRISVFIPNARVSEVAEEVFNNAAAQIVGALATDLAILVDPGNSALEEGTNGNSMINIDQTVENVPTHHKIAVRLVARAIWIVGLLTVIADGRTALSKPTSGVVFGHNKLAYYATLAVIFSLGVAELFTGVWICMSTLTYMCRLWIGGVVLFLSIWPFVGILSIGGLA